MGGVMMDQNEIFQALGYLGVNDIGSPSPTNYDEYVALVSKNGGKLYTEQEMIEAASAALLKKDKPIAVTSTDQKVRDIRQKIKTTASNPMTDLTPNEIFTVFLVATEMCGDNPGVPDTKDVI
jgi:hypothetical protein